MMLFIRAGAFWDFAAAWFLLRVGVGFMTPAFASLTSKAVPGKLRGTAFGLFSTSLGLVSLPAPAIGAQLWQRFSPRLPFALTGWAALLAVIPVWLKFRNGENHGEDSRNSLRKCLLTASSFHAIITGGDQSEISRKCGFNRNLNIILYPISG